jgi:hypothetical protein
MRPWGHHNPDGNKIRGPWMSELETQLRPWPDQWAFLASLRKLSRGQVEALVREAEARGRVVGVRMAAADAGNSRAGWTWR